MRGGMRPAAAQREVEGLHLSGDDARRGAWISCRLTMSEGALAQGLDGLHGGGGGGQGGDHQHAVQGRALADGAVVVEGLPAERRVEDDVDAGRS